MVLVNVIRSITMTLKIAFLMPYAQIIQKAKPIPLKCNANLTFST